MKIDDFFGLALRMARSRWWMYGILPREDYEQEAMLALVVADEKFDSSRGLRFTTYAHHRIKGALINAEHAWMKFNRKTHSSPQFTGIPKNLLARGMTEADIEPLFNLFEGEWFATPARLVLLHGYSVQETADRCGCRINTVHQAVSYWRKRVVIEIAN